MQMGNISVYRITIAQYEYRCTNLSLFRHRLKKGHLAKEKLYLVNCKQEVARSKYYQNNILYNKKSLDPNRYLN